MSMRAAQLHDGSAVEDHVAMASPERPADLINPAPVAAIARRIGALAAHCLHLEVDTYPKPGLVSHVDQGAHEDMDAALLHRSADTLEPFFVALAQAGAEGADMARLRSIGIDAEGAMLVATGGINTHRGAIFGLGLLAAAAGLRTRLQRPTALGPLVAARWGLDILQGPLQADSHGSVVGRRHGVGGARAEAGAGFPSLYRIALPALDEGVRLAADDQQAVRVHACLALIAQLADTNLLHRGGQEGLAFAQSQARRFLAAGGVGHARWRQHAQGIHQAFVARRLSPGGAADLLAMGLFVRELEQRDLDLRGLDLHDLDLRDLDLRDLDMRELDLRSLDGEGAPC